MNLLIITGLSGSGKSRAIDALEDIGFFCVDNMPPQLILKFAQIAVRSKETLSKLAVVTDIRGGVMFEGFYSALDALKKEKFDYKLLFLDASNEVLIRRFKETRRKHPLMGLKNFNQIDAAIAKERELLRSARERADYILETSFLSAAQLKERISALFSENYNTDMMITCMSFGFKFGEATHADLVFDVRCLPNPFYIDTLKNKTGLDAEVNEYVLKFKESKELLHKLKDLLTFLMPLYKNEGKSELMIAFGCTGGKHRSVTFAEWFYNYFYSKGYRVSVNHRDIEKR